MTPKVDTEQWHEQKSKVERFVARFSNKAYRLLARHAALPLVLTPELVHYLRNKFLRGEDVPWEAEVDLLLSDLCSQVGYELYAMDTQVRAYLLEEVKDDPFWQQRMQQVARSLIGYVNFLSRISPERRQQELAAQRLAAMVYLGDEACQKAAQEIAQRLKEASDLAEGGLGSERGIRAELARLSRITQELAPQLQQAPALVEYARLVQRVLRSPESVDSAELQQVYQVGDVALTVSSYLTPARQEQLSNTINVAGFPPLKLLDFETGQLVDSVSDFPPLQKQIVETVTLFFENHPKPSELIAQRVVRMAGGVKIGGQIQVQNIPNLQPFSFKIATLERNLSSRDDWTINRKQGSAQYYEEVLGDGLVLEMVAVPAGNFVMGSPRNEFARFEQEGPQHAVQLANFYMGRYPVTQMQWRFVAGLPQENRELDPDPSEFRGDNRPVERVSWLNAVEFCARLSQFVGREYRLPTEAEWEYTCRAGTSTPFHFGETIAPYLANYGGSEGYNGGPTGEYRQETTPVDHFGIANAFGLCDMHGNVYEWCQDYWHDSYEGAPTDGSAWLTENERTDRVVRGGSWDLYPRYCRSAYRNCFSPDSRDSVIGFRVVCSAPRTL